ncbi:hypothetical protein ILYODFUR_027972 [Ilyodon furcidens]|uniref:Uncharacterized protein n=1 Tax=Ilyodon furcidens TaxID=33524 RepID=A0ABV0T0T2_9TELE
MGLERHLSVFSLHCSMISGPKHEEKQQHVKSDQMKVFTQSPTVTTALIGGIFSTSVTGHPEAFSTQQQELLRCSTSLISFIFKLPVSLSYLEMVIDKVEKAQP